MEWISGSCFVFFFFVFSPFFGLCFLFVLSLAFGTGTVESTVSLRGTFSLEAICGVFFFFFFGFREGSVVAKVSSNGEGACVWVLSSPLVVAGVWIVVLVPAVGVLVVFVFFVLCFFVFLSRSAATGGDTSLEAGRSDDAVVVLLEVGPLIVSLGGTIAGMDEPSKPLLVAFPDGEVVFDADLEAFMTDSSFVVVFITGGLLLLLVLLGGRGAVAAVFRRAANIISSKRERLSITCDLVATPTLGFWSFPSFMAPSTRLSGSDSNEASGGGIIVRVSAMIVLSCKNKMNSSLPETEYWLLLYHELL